MFDLNKIQTFSRMTKLFNKKIERKHIYMPWEESYDHELMYKIKKAITDRGHCLIPISKEIKESDIQEINYQVAIGGEESHLIMSNHEVVHILNIENIFQTKNSPSAENTISINKELDISYWVKVTDIYLLNVSHSGDQREVKNKLNDFMCSTQEGNLFLNKRSELHTHENKWVFSDRQVTYEYFNHLCELEETIYSKCWGHISKKAQHHLVQGEKLRKESISLRSSQKWESLKESFHSYEKALMAELNEIYIFPLVDLLTKNENFQKLWKEFEEDHFSNEEMVKTINQLAFSSSESIENIEDIQNFIGKLKSILFTLKNKIKKYSFNEDYLYIEQFLNKLEGKVESFRIKKISKKISSIQKICTWMKDVDKVLLTLDSKKIKSTSLKLSHLLSLINSSSEDNNVLFALLEEKMECTLLSNGLEEELNTLYSEEDYLLSA